MNQHGMYLRRAWSKGTAGAAGTVPAVNAAEQEKRTRVKAAAGVGMRVIRLSLLAVFIAVQTFPALAAITVEGKIPESVPDGAYPVRDFAAAVEGKTVSVIDVRTAKAYARRHLTESQNLPYGDRKDWIPSLESGRAYVFICDEGDLAQKVVEEIRRQRPEMKDSVFYLDAEIAFQKNGDIYIEAN